MRRTSPSVAAAVRIDVVASTRLVKGQPGLRIDPAALLRQVKSRLGPCPHHIISFCYWGAALINPFPVLGASPEIRGRVLEAPTALEKLISSMFRRPRNRNQM